MKRPKPINANLTDSNANISATNNISTKSEKNLRYVFPLIVQINADLLSIKSVLTTMCRVTYVRRASCVSHASCPACCMCPAIFTQEGATTQGGEKCIDFLASPRNANKVKWQYYTWPWPDFSWLSFHEGTQVCWWHHRHFCNHHISFTETVAAFHENSSEKYVIGVIHSNCLLLVKWHGGLFDIWG